ncbi:MAG TPA: hypothetical protein VEA99_10605 [Gemmatimonadaceae bacterium]|nr:hypothetical protein [Gemmatimonadaceae bacterium]
MRSVPRARRLSTILLLGLGAVTAGCLPPTPRPGRDLDRAILLSSQVPTQFRATTALDMLRHVRPEFLANRSRTLRLGAPTEPVVYVDGIRLAEMAMLRHVATTSIVSVRYVRGIDAVVRHGADHESGVLFVTTAWEP